MSTNIFTSENIKKYNCKPTVTTGIGEWTTYAGENCINIAPNPFYISSTATYVKILENEFVPNTQYIVDLWLNTDDTIYQEKNVNGGGYIVYTDGTSKRIIHEGPNKGYVRYRFKTDTGKSVSHFQVQYYVNIPVHYRWDSFICPVDTVKINETGQLTPAKLCENTDQASFFAGGSVYTNEIIEY